MKSDLHKGSSTIELLIAFAILTITLTAVIMVVFGNQSVTVDTQTNTEAIAQAQQQLEDARANAKTNYLGVVSNSSTNTIGPVTYTKALTVSDLTPCLKQATSTITWNVSPTRPQTVSLTSYITDIAGALALGGDCAASPPTSGWTNPQRFASDTLSPGKPISMDVLDRIAYLGLDKAPFLAIADTNGATLHQTSGLFVSFTNGFSAGAQINAIDAVRWTDPSTGVKKVYLFAMMNTTSSQLKVIDATTPTAPTTVATRSLTCVTTSGSFPQGWYAYAYGTRLYVVTRETAGPELHIFDISTPSNPTEITINSSACKGYELTDTVEQLIVRDQVVNGTTKRYAYLATDESNRELRTLDVTGDAVSEATDVDLPGAQDGASLFLVGTKLYLGRMNVSNGPELYVFDASKPSTSLPQLGTAEIGTDVLDVRVAYPFAFLAVSKTNKEFQVWNISNLSNITNIATYNFGNIVSSGIDYEPDYIYATGQSTPNFQILYSP